MKRLILPFFAAILTLGSCCNSQENVFVAEKGSGIDCLHAPWDGLDDDTIFRCFSDDETFYFYYKVNDATVTLVDDFRGESDVEPEDRVEIFFSPKQSMDIYYCAEIDPAGRVLDYSSEYYRKMDYDWDFQTMELQGKITEYGYIVYGSVSKAELRELGNDLDNGFWMGVFRADFRKDGSVNWYSAIPTDDKSPDFHKPDVLFKAIIK